MTLCGSLGATSVPSTMTAEQIAASLPSQPTSAITIPASRNARYLTLNLEKFAHRNVVMMMT